MDLSLPAIYGSALRGIRNNLLVYVLLLLWGVVQGIIIVALLFLGSTMWLASIASLSAGPSFGSGAFYISVLFVGTILVMLAIFSAITRAGVLSFGAGIRKGKKGRAVDFFRGILRFTLPLFVGGIVVGMLTSIPLLAFLAAARWTAAGAVSDVFTSGWNFNQSMQLIRQLWNMMSVAAVFQLLIFFWIAPWDEMVVLYELPYPEALSRSLTFVFSRRHFLRVLGLIVANVLIAQLALVLTNIGVFIEGLHTSSAVAYLRVLASAPTSTFTSFLQFVMLPFFAYSQLFLLPWPRSAHAADAYRETVTRGAFETPSAV